MNGQENGDTEEKHQNGTKLQTTELLKQWSMEYIKSLKILRNFINSLKIILRDFIKF